MLRLNNFSEIMLNFMKRSQFHYRHRMYRGRIKQLRSAECSAPEIFQVRPFQKQKSS